MGSKLLGGAEGGGAEREFESALAEGRVTEAAQLAVDLARRRLHGIAASAARVERTLDQCGLEPPQRIALVRELAMLHARAGCFDRAFETMTLALTLAQEADARPDVCEAELRGAFFAVQVGELDHAHDLLDNAECHAAALGDDLRLGFARMVRGIAVLAEDAADEAVLWIADGVRRIGEADSFDRAFVLRQQARALVRAGRHEAAATPLADALASALERSDHTQLADCLETFAALAADVELAARALGAAATFRERGASVRWADETDEAVATQASVRTLIGYDRADDLAAAGSREPEAVAAAALDRLT